MMPRGRATPARSIILIVTDLYNCLYRLCFIKVISRKESLVLRGGAAPAKPIVLIMTHVYTCLLIFLSSFQVFIFILLLLFCYFYYYAS